MKQGKLSLPNKCILRLEVCFSHNGLQTPSRCFLYDAFFLWSTQPYAGSLNKPSVIRTLKPFLTMPALMDSSHVCKKYSLFFYFYVFLPHFTTHISCTRLKMAVSWHGNCFRWGAGRMNGTTGAPLSQSNQLYCLLFCQLLLLSDKGATPWSMPGTLTFLFPFFVHQPAEMQADGQKTCCTCHYCKTGSMFCNSSIKCLVRGLF